MSDLLGLPASKVIDRDFRSFLWFSELEEQQWLRTILRNKSFTGLEKEIFYEEIHHKLICKFNGRLIQDDSARDWILISCEDVTSYHLGKGNLQTQLSMAHSELENITHFAHMVSHNLKGHATNLGLLLNFLDNEENDVERENLLSVIYQSTENLTSGIKDLRQLVAIRQHVNCKNHALAVNDFFYGFLEGNKGLIKQYDAKIHNEIPDDFTVMAVDAYLESILGEFTGKFH